MAKSQRPVIMDKLSSSGYIQLSKVECNLCMESCCSVVVSLQ
jgi:hypothetical protein